jgi:hypothetical protein
MGYHTPEVGVGVATWEIRRGWPMTHWRESASLMWRNLDHVAGAYSEHAKTKRHVQRRSAWGDAHRAAGTHRTHDTSRKRSHTTTRRCGAICTGPAYFNQPEANYGTYGLCLVAVWRIFCLR